MVVSVGLPDGRLEDIAKVILSDSSKNCRIVKLDFGPLLEEHAVAEGSCLDPPSLLRVPAPEAQEQASAQPIPSDAA